MTRHALQVSMISSYPPTICGVGRFAHSLTKAVSDRETAVSIIRVVNPTDGPAFGRGVVMEYSPDETANIAAIARAIDSTDAAIVQHEFGLYGHNDGEQIVEIVRRVSAPTICVLHTVVREPTDRQRRITEELAHNTRLVVPSHAAQVLLDDEYGVPAHTVSVIPHGTHWTPRSPSAGSRHTVVSWGLLGPGKGLERMIRALPHVAEFVPDVRYVIAGQTHPNVYRQSGSEYRKSLRSLAEKLGVSHRVEFDDRFLTEEDLVDVVAESDVVAIPYDNDEQISSGVLVEAISLGRPVVATRFPHAIELLTTGAGELVDHDGDSQLADAVSLLLTDDKRYHRALLECRRKASEMSWERVASRYRSLITTTLSLAQNAV